MGLAGMLEIGRPDGNLPLVTKNNIPIRDMALQYNFVFDRRNGGHQLNNPYWEQWVSTLKPPEGNQLADGTYRPSLAPVNFAKSSKGAEYFTNWYAGPLSIRNHRGQNQFIPQNLQTFTSPTKTIPANPALPENERDVQFTINGQFQPELKVKPGQTEIWVFANMSDIAFVPLRFTETATGNHPKFAVVGQDGNPYTQVQRPVDGDGTYLEIPPGSRYADRGDDAEDRRPRRRHAARPGCQGHRRTRCAVYEQRHREFAGRAGQGDHRSQVHRGARRLLHVPDADAAEGHARHRRGADHGIRAGPEPGRLHVVRGHLGDGARRQARASRSVVVSATRRRKNDPKAFTYQFDEQHLPQHPADPADG